MKAIFKFITDEKTGATEQLTVPADALDEHFNDKERWFVAWKGENVVAIVNAKFVKFCYLEEAENVQGVQGDVKGELFNL